MHKYNAENHMMGALAHEKCAAAVTFGRILRNNSVSFTCPKSLVSQDF